MASFSIDGYELRSELFYDRATDMWIAVDGTVAHVGYDPLGLEINGTLAQLVIADLGNSVARGQTIGTLEAEKFVGPINSPVSGIIKDVNNGVLDSVSQIHVHPYDSWLFAVSMSNLDELDLFVTGENITPVFEHRLAEYRIKGVLAR